MIAELLIHYRHWCLSQDSTATLADIVLREQALLDQPDYLVSDVIGRGEFDWDFRCLNDGFLQLVLPYMEQSSGSAPLFLSVLSDLKASSPTNEQAILLVEFGHFAALINDYYSFHEDLVADDVSPGRVSLLTQLRYAGQYLSNYPRYLLVRNRFQLGDRQQIDLHQALAGVVVTYGISRGVTLKWIERKYESVSREQYLQNGINAVHSYVILPVVLAMVLAGVDKKTINEVRGALGYLALAMKLAMERATLTGDGISKLSAAARTTATALSFPGLPFVDQRRPFDVAPSMDDLFNAAQESLLPNADEVINNYNKEIRVFLTLFEQQLTHGSILKRWGAELASTLANGGSIDA